MMMPYTSCAPDGRPNKPLRVVLLSVLLIACIAWPRIARSQTSFTIDSSYTEPSDTVATFDLTVLGDQPVERPRGQWSTSPLVFEATAYDGRPGFLVQGQQHGMKISEASFVTPKTTVAWSWKKEVGKLCLVQIFLRNPSTGKTFIMGYGAGSWSDQRQLPDATVDIFVEEAIPTSWARVERNLYEDVRNLLGWQSAKIEEIYLSPWETGPGWFADMEIRELAKTDVAALRTQKARFQVLAPDLIRMEYSPTGEFIDAPSVAVLKRSWPAVNVRRSQDENGWLVLDTGTMTLRYKNDGAPFTEDSLAITWNDADGEHRWQPGAEDKGNLGGVVGDIAIRSVPVTDPGLLSREGWYLLDDSGTAIHDRATEWVKARPVQGGQDLFFFVYGRDFASMLKRCAELLGPVPLIPRYVLGAWFGSRCGYAANQWQLIVDRYREEHLPLDMLVVDSCSWTNVVWSGYDFDREQMPDPAGWLKWMRERGIRTTFNEHYAPLTPESDRNFEAIRKLMGYPEDSKQISHDLGNKQYAKAFVNLLLKPMLDMGMAFWWQDGCAGAAVEGLDPMMWTREIEYLGQERLTGQRSFAFCRLGAWGSHRSGGFFSSDLIPQWNTLTLIVPFTQQSGNMLVPYVINLCTAVYGVNVEPELYHRWVQFSAFSPVLWFHGLWGMRLPWEYGEAGVENYRQFVGLRYALLPYTYTMARVAHDCALPLVRGMYLQYPNEEQAFQFRHQFMFGHDLLVAPVTEPGRGKPVVKDVYLPAGDNWYDYFTGDYYRGGQVVAYTCPLDRMPLFVRAGSIIPMAPPMDFTDQKPVDPLTLDVYASAEGAAFKLYEDDGVSLEYRKNQLAWTPLAFAPKGDGGDHVLTISPAEGSFAGQLLRRRYQVRVHGLVKPASIKVDGQAIAEKTASEDGTLWFWDLKTRTTTIRLMDPLSTSKAVEVILEGAGTHLDGQLLQHLVDYRDRVRRVKHEQKLKYAFLNFNGGGEHDKPPRVIRETEAVEAQLNQGVGHAQGLGQNPPDFRALTARLLRAMVEQPFECDRTIPSLNATSKEATANIEQGVFEPAELRKMTAILLGLEMPTRTVWAAPAHFTTGQYLQVLGNLNYDGEAIGPAQVRYELEMPQEADGLSRSWVAGAPSAAANGYTQFGIQVPHPARFGPHVFKMKGIVAWEGGEAEITREVEWLSTALP